MKKVLLATTALIASAGFASAQVAISGSAEMGVVGGDGGGGAHGETQFWQDIEVTFALSGMTDNGLEFGASIQLDEAGWGNHYDDGGTAVFISGGFGTLTMGDTDGGFDWALTEIGAGGSIDDAHTSHGGYSGNAGLDGDFDGQVLRYDNTFGDFGVAASLELDDTAAPLSEAVVGLGARYSAAMGGVDLSFGLGFQQSTNAGGMSVQVVGVSVAASMASGFGLVLNHWTGDTDYGGVEETYTGIGASYSAGGITVAGNYGRFEEGAVEDTGYGIAVNYDLGGGAAVQFGYGNSDCGGVYGGCTTGDQWSLGVAMSF